MAEVPNKRQKTEDDTFHLIYWPGMPGRGEHIRLALEEAGVSYTDTAQIEGGMDQVLAQISKDNLGDESNPPPRAPPILKHGSLTLCQTPAILSYLGPLLSLSPSPTESPSSAATILSLTLTALDGLSNEPHDTHHPIATSLYYEDQKEAALAKSKDYIQNRLPGFLNYFERVLTNQEQHYNNTPNTKPSDTEIYLHGNKLTYVDLVLFQCLDGVQYAFPNAVARIRKEDNYPRVWGLYEQVKNRERIKAYLESGRRQDYSMGIYRRYPELDEEMGK